VSTIACTAWLKPVFKGLPRATRRRFYSAFPCTAVQPAAAISVRTFRTEASAILASSTAFSVLSLVFPEMPNSPLVVAGRLTKSIELTLVWLQSRSGPNWRVRLPSRALYLKPTRCGACSARPQQLLCQRVAGIEMGNRIEPIASSRRLRCTPHRSHRAASCLPALWLGWSTQPRLLSSVAIAFIARGARVVFFIGGRVADRSPRILVR